MPIYHRLGNIPHKRHTQFRDKNGNLYHEQLIGTRGFEGPQSLLYRIYPPTEISKCEVLSSDIQPRLSHSDAELRHRHLKLGESAASGDPISGRRFVLANEDIAIGICSPDKPMDYFFANGVRDEMLFVHDGVGVIDTMYGALSYRPGDYIMIPKGTIYQIKFQPGKQSRFLVVETPGNLVIPKRYYNEYGQLLEDSPYCARDIRLPGDLNPHDEKGDFIVHVKGWRQVMSYHWTHHPFDVVGWDGYLFPWILNIEDFEPITGRVHMPPPVHQTFAGQNFVVCSFVPRLFDYHPLSIPVPYNHSNLQSDEVLYYVNGNFMSRRGIDRGSLTLHPAGIPHGPHPGTVEKSLGSKETNEVAVMIDTFRPLHITEDGHVFDDAKYPYSWLP